MKFALTGAAGYVAPRHMKAIFETGNELVAALDPHDSVGILDRYAPRCAYFKDEEKFWQHVRGEAHYVSICSPNYLHVAQIVSARCHGLDVICEKPIATSYPGLVMVAPYERGHVSTILQLRLHPAVVALQRRVEATQGHRWRVELTYVTPRGPWYDSSWKSSEPRSGGLILNIGIHLFDLLLWVFGACTKHEIHLHEARRVSGWLELENADVSWFLSTAAEDLPEDPIGGLKAYRALTADGERVDFSDGFTDLHTESYRQILSGNGFGVEHAKPSIHLVDDLRADAILADVRPDAIRAAHDAHPLCQRLP